MWLKMRLHFCAARRAEQTPVLFINLGTIHFHLAGSKRRLSSSQHSISLLSMRVLLSGDVLRARCVCRWKRRFACLDKWKTGVLKGGLHIHSRANVQKVLSEQPRSIVMFLAALFILWRRSPLRPRQKIISSGFLRARERRTTGGRLFALWW